MDLLERRQAQIDSVRLPLFAVTVTALSAAEKAISLKAENVSPYAPM